MIPQIIVTLSPSGALIAELPGPNGARRQIELKSTEVESSLRRMLSAQQWQKVQIGEDGAPTAAQVKHWEKHSLWSDPSCSFCIAEQRFESGAIGTLRSRAKRDETLLKRDGIEITRLKTLQAKKRGLTVRAEVPEGSGL